MADRLTRRALLRIIATVLVATSNGYAAAGRLLVKKAAQAPIHDVWMVEASHYLDQAYQEELVRLATKSKGESS